MSDSYDMYSKVYCGNEIPKINSRLSTAFRYKTLSVNMNFELRLGGQKFNQTLLDKEETQRWEKPGDVTRYKGLNNDTNTPANSRFVADESTFILRNVNIQYDFPRRISRFFGMERLSISGNLNDLFYLSTIEQERGIN